MTPPHHLTPARVALIRVAIERVKEARARYQAASADLEVANQLVADSAKDSFVASVREFAWQWENVEAVLDALAPYLKGD